MLSSWINPLLLLLLVVQFRCNRKTARQISLQLNELNKIITTHKLNLRFHLFELGIVWCLWISIIHWKSGFHHECTPTINGSAITVCFYLCSICIFTLTPLSYTCIGFAMFFVVCCCCSVDLFANWFFFFKICPNFSLNLAHNGLGADQCQWMATATVITTLNTTRVSGVEVNVGILWENAWLAIRKRTHIHVKIALFVLLVGWLVVDVRIKYSLLNHVSDGVVFPCRLNWTWLSVLLLLLLLLQIKKTKHANKLKIWLRL